MEKKRILTVIPFTENQKKRLEEAAAGAELCFRDLQSITAEEVKRAEIILGNVPAEMVKEAERLEWLHLNSAGFDDYVKEGILREKTLLTNSSGAYGKRFLSICLQCFWLCRKNCIYIVTCKDSICGEMREK